MFDVLILFSTRCLRMFSYGAITVVFFLALNAEFSPTKTDEILTAILLGDLLVSLYLTTRADHFGRKNTLLIGSLLKMFAGLSFAYSNNFTYVVISGIIGVISPTGGDVGPFVAVEQSSLTTLVSVNEDGSKRSQAEASVRVTNVFAIYQLCGSVALALGAAFAGWLVEYLQSSSDFKMNALQAYQAVFTFYGICGLVKALLYMLLSPQIEAPSEDLAAKSTALKRSNLLFGGLLVGLESDESRVIVAKLCALFSLDAFGGGLVLQSYMAWWFNARWGVSPLRLGELLLGVNIIAGASGMVAKYFVQQFGAINTMVFTHLPSNILLAMVPLMPSESSAVIMLLLRFSISQMDVPARQAYVTLVVRKSEQSAAGGWTNCARSVGVALAPFVLSFLPALTQSTGGASSLTWMDVPWILSGLLKSLYDILLYMSFHSSGAQVGQTQSVPVAETSSTKNYGSIKA